MRTPILSYIVICILFPVLSFGRQVAIQTIKEQSPIRHIDYTFPRIVYQADKTVADTINHVLIADFLSIDPKEVRKSIFEAIWPQEGEAIPPSLSEISWEVHTNTAKLFSLAISAEGCGAYCEYFTSYYCFDLKTGELLGLDQLFTEDGLRLLRDSVNSLKKHRIQAMMKTLRQSLLDTAQHKEREVIEEKIALYRDCLEQEDIDRIEGQSFHFNRNSLFIHVGRCSAHYNRGFDDLGDFEFSFRYNDLKQHLTPYGRQLLLQ